MLLKTLKERLKSSSSNWRIRPSIENRLSTGKKETLKIRHVVSTSTYNSDLKLQLLVVFSDLLTHKEMTKLRKKLP